MKGQALDIVGQRYGRLIVVKRHGVNACRHVVWLCHCDCGGTSTPTGCALRSGRARSCGCANIKHGKATAREYVLWHGGKVRAKRDNLPFALCVADMEIPSECEMCHQPFVEGHEGWRQGLVSTLDRVVPRLGYIPSNIRYIHHRCNCLKGAATADDVRMLATYLGVALANEVEFGDDWEILIKDAA